MKSRKSIATTRNGYEVFVDTVGSHAATHLADDSDLLGLVVELLSRTDIHGENVAFEKNMGRVIGEMDLVETDDTDEIIYAKRVNRENYTRFVRNRERAPTQYLTIILKKHDDGYELWSAWIGRLVPPFPGDEHERPESKDFWASHALVWGKQSTRKETITDIQPW